MRLCRLRQSARSICRHTLPCMCSGCRSGANKTPSEPRYNHTRTLVRRPRRYMSAARGRGGTIEPKRGSIQSGHGRQRRNHDTYTNESSCLCDERVLLPLSLVLRRLGRLVCCPGGWEAAAAAALHCARWLRLGQTERKLLQRKQSWRHFCLFGVGMENVGVHVWAYAFAAWLTHEGPHSAPSGLGH